MLIPIIGTDFFLCFLFFLFARIFFSAELLRLTVFEIRAICKHTQSTECKVNYQPFSEHCFNSTTLYHFHVTRFRLIDFCVKFVRAFEIDTLYPICLCIQNFRLDCLLFLKSFRVREKFNHNWKLESRVNFALTRGARCEKINMWWEEKKIESERK